MPQLLNTVFDLPAPLARTLTRGSHEPQSITLDVRPDSVHISDREAQPEIAPANASDEFKLPKLTSLIIVLLASALLQVSFFIVVSSSNEYAKHLGGTSTFSGLVIGIPTVFSGLALVPLAKFDGGGYKRPLHFACASALLGNVLYSLAYYANFLYLILIGRIVSGFGFTFWMYSKRYCSDPRIVGVRRRTMLAGWLVLGQGVGFSVGPFVGGLLYKVGFSNAVFNGYTSPTWVLSALWAVFWLVAALLYEDVPPKPPAGTQVELQPASPSRNRQQTLRNKSSRDITSEGIVVPHEETPRAPDASYGSASGTLTPRQPSAAPSEEKASSTEIIVAAPSDGTDADTAQPTLMRMSAAQWGVTATMCWFAMTCFFILGAWEANIPVFTESNLRVNPFHFSPSAAGNLIALGGICTIPFLLVNLVAARRVQDRHTLAVGSGLGLVGLLIAIGILRGNAVNYGSLFICWFLVALGFNLASTVTLSLLSKQLPGEWNMRISMAIQYSNYTGRVCGAVWGGAGTKVGMLSYVGLQIALVGIGAVMFSTLWKQLKAKTG